MTTIKQSDENKKMCQLNKLELDKVNGGFSCVQVEESTEFFRQMIDNICAYFSKK